MLAYLLARAKEPSTYAGLATILGLIGIKVAPDQFAALVAVATSVAAAVAVFLPDIKPPASNS